MPNARVLEINEYAHYNYLTELKTLSVDDFLPENFPKTLTKLDGQNPQMAKDLIDTYLIREVPETALPYRGYVWLRNGKNGRLEFFKSTL